MNKQELIKQPINKYYNEKQIECIKSLGIFDDLNHIFNMCDKLKNNSEKTQYERI